MASEPVGNSQYWDRTLFVLGRRSNALAIGVWCRALKANYAINPIAEQALRPNHLVVPQRVIAALDLLGRS